MAPPRLVAGLLVSALIRRVEAVGGGAMVLAKGDATSGAMLVQLADRGVAGALLERRLGVEGYEWAATGPDDSGDRSEYVVRRRRGDPDLWIVELDHRDAEVILREVIP